MSDDAGAYLLLAVDLLVVATVLTLPVLALWWLVGRPRDEPISDHARGLDREPSSREPVLRRCDDCGVGWKGRPGDDAGVTVLKLRRRKRRSTREKKQDTPDWARRRGWSRCPSCLSTNVRTSSRHTTGA